MPPEIFTRHWQELFFILRKAQRLQLSACVRVGVQTLRGNFFLLWDPHSPFVDVYI